MDKSKARHKIEIDPATMPEGHPCAKCVRSCTIQPCVRFRIFYEEFMHRCRVATGCETPSREEQFREHIKTLAMFDQFDDEDETTIREERGRMLYEKIKESGLSYRDVAERINLSKSTIWGYIKNGVSKRNAAMVIAAVDDMVREAKEDQRNRKEIV